MANKVTLTLKQANTKGEHIKIVFMRASENDDVGAMYCGEFLGLWGYNPIRRIIYNREDVFSVEES